MTSGNKRSALGALDSCRLGGYLGACGLAAALFTAGCGGSDGKGNGPDAGGIGDGIAPTVHVAFPPPISLTDTAMITIRGTVADADGVAAVRVNGTDARLSAGGTEWEATVALTHGENDLAIATEDTAGALDVLAAQVTVVLSANWMVTPRAVAADVTNGRALVLDSALDVLLAVDLATGERTVLSSDDVGSGPRLDNPIALAVDADGGRILVLDEGLPALLAVDPATGDRTVIADATTGAGPALVTPVAMDVDLAGGRALILDNDLTTTPGTPLVTLYSVDLTTGERTVIADAATGDGALLIAPVAVAIDVANDRALVLDVDETVPSITLYAVALDTGAATVVSDATSEGSPIDSPSAMLLDTSVDPATRVIVLDEGADAVLAVDLATGARSIVSADDNKSDEPQLSVPTAIALEVGEQSTRILVLDSGLDALLAVQPATGARSFVTGVSIGKGPGLGDPVAMMYDNSGDSLGQAVVLDGQQDACIAVDIATGERILVADDATGSGTPLQGPRAVSLDIPVGPTGQSMPANRVLVADEDLAALVYVNLANGSRTVLADANTGAGPALDVPVALTIQPADEVAGIPYRALVLDIGLDALVAVDLATGDRTVISDAQTGAGPAFGEPLAVSIEIDDSLGLPTGRALVVDTSLDALVAVDLANGDRTVIADANTGTGPLLENPLALLLDTKLATIEDANTGETSTAYVSTGRALVVDAGQGALLAVDLASGTRNELSGPQFGKGPELTRPTGVALDADDERALLVDEGLEALLMIDLRTGERVIVSR